MTSASMRQRYPAGPAASSSTGSAASDKPSGRTRASARQGPPHRAACPPRPWLTQLPAGHRDPHDAAAAGHPLGGQHQGAAPPGLAEESSPMPTTRANRGAPHQVGHLGHSRQQRKTVARQYLCHTVDNGPTGAVNSRVRRPRWSSTGRRPSAAGWFFVGGRTANWRGAFGGGPRRIRAARSRHRRENARSASRRCRRHGPAGSRPSAPVRSAVTPVPNGRAGPRRSRRRRRPSGHRLPISRRSVAQPRPQCGKCWCPYGCRPPGHRVAVWLPRQEPAPTRTTAAAERTWGERGEFANPPASSNGGAGRLRGRHRLPAATPAVTAPATATRTTGPAGCGSPWCHQRPHDQVSDQQADPDGGAALA